MNALPPSDHSAPRLNVLGIMSGTSIDGVDYALCTVSPGGIALRQLWHAAFPRLLRRRLHAAAGGASACWEVAQLHHDLGRFYAQGARDGLGSRRVDLAGLHGQTVFHNPDPRAPATLQIGEPAWLAEALRVPVVSNFRAGDLAAGGQGAPLATLFHQVVFAERGKHVCVHNLGGISNVTSLDWRQGAAPRVLAFDTGPANLLIDMAARHFSDGRECFDRAGRGAAAGRPCEALLKRWLAHPFLAAAPPKSTGREMFGDSFFRRALRAMETRPLSRADALATFTEFTARSIALNYQLHLPKPLDRVILAGGGAANLHLVSRLTAILRDASPELVVMTAEVRGWPRQAIEPAAFALLAWRRWCGFSGNLPATTGARHAVPCGQVTLPRPRRKSSRGARSGTPLPVPLPTRSSWGEGILTR